MISKIAGKIVEKSEGAVQVNTGGLCYEVLIPKAVMALLEAEGKFDDVVELVTYHYFQMSQSSGVPVLIGFQNNVEREFFEKFISVSGIGPKAACRALAEPFSVIAGAIDSGDELLLKSLPGIGARKAAEIVAKLKGKVGKFGLIRDEDVTISKENRDISAEAIEILLQLQYKRPEAEGMIQKAFQRAPKIRTAEELLNEVYREKAQR